MGFTPHLFSPLEYRDVIKFGIGLIDINKIVFGADCVLSKSSFGGSALKERIQKYKPRALALNGQKWAQIYFERPDVSYGLQDVSYHRNTSIHFVFNIGRGMRLLG